MYWWKDVADGAARKAKKGRWKAVKEDMKLFGVTEVVAEDRAGLKQVIQGGDLEKILDDQIKVLK